MPKQDFKPPKQNRAIQALANACVSYALRARNVADVQTRPKDLAILKSLAKERVVLMPNHPTNTEPAVLFSRMLPRAVQFAVFAALLESNAAENGARMSAMDAATSNARDMIDDLTVQMNRIRQAAITKEIIEVVSGAQALS